ncbi:hypothetical protein FIBSPDRAFT_1039526 [Athelia psychrophila]|uniref:DUF6532 domain-containing protein n=1 Tax=Athelia psychrophila TaxID=1759441 RepID=A0A166RL78_9AGAM|nr:hypothetical protein FIBSPDRAFT_1039526 [Fibularhizoctonia sp. CBS 109695]
MENYEGDENIFGQPTPTPTDTVTGTKRYFLNHSENEDEPDGDGSPPSKRPALSTLPLLRKRIVELGKDAVRVSIATQDPFAAGPTMDRILTTSWLYGHKSVKADFDLMGAELKVHVPIEAELTVLKGTFAQHRGVVKTFAQKYVVKFYGLEEGAGDKTSIEVINKNRQKFEILMEKAGFAYMDPSNRTKAGTIYRNTIILMIICKAWFSEGSESLGISRSDAFNPDGDGIPFETIAFVLTAVHNAILEYEKGYFVQRDFAAKKFSKQYMKYLGKLHKWHTFTTVQRNTRTSEKVRQELYTAACEHAGVTIQAEEYDDGPTSSDFEVDEAF